MAVFRYRQGSYSIQDRSRNALASCAILRDSPGPLTFTL
jgi:hypothetical protein